MFSEECKDFPREENQLSVPLFYKHLIQEVMLALQLCVQFLSLVCVFVCACVSCVCIQSVLWMLLEVFYIPFLYAPFSSFFSKLSTSRKTHWSIHIRLDKKKKNLCHVLIYGQMMIFNSLTHHHLHFSSKLIISSAFLIIRQIIFLFRAD